MRRLLAVPLVLALAGCPATSAPESPAAGPATAPAGAPTARPGPTAARGAPALTLLAGLRVQGRGPGTGYHRGRFGPAWADADRNGCDTRNDVLRRDLGEVVLWPGTRGCVVLSGALRDPYTGRVLAHRQRHG